MTRSSSTKKPKSNTTKMELKKLKSLLPTLKQKPASSPIEIVLETIRYIRQLEDLLIDRFHMDTCDNSSLTGKIIFFYIIKLILFYLVPFTTRTSLSDMSTLSTDSSLLRDIGNMN